MPALHKASRKDRAFLFALRITQKEPRTDGAIFYGAISFDLLFSCNAMSIAILRLL